MSDGDIARIQQSLPTLEDSKAQKQAKMQAINALLKDRYNTLDPNRTKRQQNKPSRQTESLSPIEQEMKRRGLL